jgi:asparagine synthase (glutamine-hydrolysing)
LSRLVRENNFKVVMTGEGADEILGGYDIFKETLIRSFWAKNPDSRWRPSLLKKLYPTLPVSASRAEAYLKEFYKTGLTETDQYYFAHMPRMSTATMIKMFYTPQVRESLGDYDSRSAFGSDLPDAFFKWHHLSRAQFIEARSLLAGYILSSQGDRVSAANSVEGRFPFLDHRVVEFAASLPPRQKILGLNEKFVLKKAMAPELTLNILGRVKQPYMAPDSNSFVQADAPDYVGEMLSEEALARAGIFNPSAVRKLHGKCLRLADKHLSFKDNMSFVAILSTQLLVWRYLDNFQQADHLPQDAFTVWRDFSSATGRATDTRSTD